MNEIVNYFACGVYASHSTRSYGEYRIVALDKIIVIIIPKTAGGRLGFSRLAGLETFFNKYPLLGYKKFNFQKFCDCAYLMKDKAQLTPQGLEKIRSIKAVMNKRVEEK